MPTLKVYLISGISVFSLLVFFSLIQCNTSTPKIPVESEGSPPATLPVSSDEASPAAPPRAVTAEVPVDPHVDRSAPEIDVNSTLEMMERFAPRASGFCLAEIADVTIRDYRPNDGCLYQVVKLNVLKSSGNTRDEIFINIAYSGYGSAGYTIVNPHPLKPGILGVGDKCWFSFCCNTDFKKYPQKIIDYWLVHSAAGREAIVADDLIKLFERAIETDCYQWHPEYDPRVDMILEYKIDEDNGRKILRMIKRNEAARRREVVWQKIIPWDPLSEPHYYVPLSPVLNEENNIGSYSTVIQLTDLNDYHIPAGKYYEVVKYELASGKRRAIIIRDFKDRVERHIMTRYFSKETGVICKEERFDDLEEGGWTAGASTKKWKRKTLMLYDEYDGHLTEICIYRLQGREWIEVKPKVIKVDPYYL